MNRIKGLNLLVCAIFLSIGTVCGVSQERNAPSAMLQDDYKRAFNHLDKLAGTFQYLGQVVNASRVYEPAKKRAIRFWLLERLTDIKKIRPSHERLNEQTLIKILQNTRVLGLHLIRTLEVNFEQLESYIPPITEVLEEPLTQEDAEDLYRKTGAYLAKNEDLLLRIENEVETVGLTSTNLWARYVDDINNKYGITSILEQIPRYAVLTALGLYLTPYNKVKSIPLLGRIKRLVGSTDYFDRQGHAEIKAFPNAVPADEQLIINAANQTNSSLAGFLNSQDKAAFERLAVGAFFLLTQNYLTDYLTPIKDYIRPYWNRLKGFNVGKVGTYRHPDITLDDQKLIGLESQIEQMRNIVGYITEPEKYDRSASGLEKGILFTGPSRSGKTLLARALCGTLNEKMQEKGMTRKFVFKEIKWSDIWWSSDGIKSIIEEAKQNAPCVVFLDELHNLPLQTKEGGKVLSQFLTMSDSLQSTSIQDTVILLAATNRAYALDDALLKPGRFGLQIHFENPSCNQRKKFFTVMCERNALDPQDYDLDLLARQTEGCSYGDLDMVFKNARFAAHNNGRQLRQSDFQDNIDVEINRLRFKQELPLSPQARTLLSTHQAGHAFMYLTHEDVLHERLETVTIRGQWNKIVEKRWIDPEVKKIRDEKKITYGHMFTSHTSEAVDLNVDPLIKAQVLLAGHVAERILLGSTAYSYHPKDRKNALKELEKIALKGLDEKAFPRDELIGPKKEAKRLLDQCEKEVTQLLTRNKNVIQQIAQELNEKTVLRHADLKKILENHGK